MHKGGPVECGRGFVLHSRDYEHENTLHIDDDMALTATVDVIKALAAGEGPDKSVFALGYSGWGAGQLNDEIRANGWLVARADPAIIFDGENETKWNRALASIGIDPASLSSAAGRA